jgi:hypothetical protein
MVSVHKLVMLSESDIIKELDINRQEQQDKFQQPSKQYIKFCELKVIRHKRR